MRFAIQHRVPIVPVATVGGHDTVFVLSEGRFIAKWSGLGKRLRGSTMPIISGFPFPLAVEILLRRRWIRWRVGVGSAMGPNILD